MHEVLGALPRPDQQRARPRPRRGGLRSRGRLTRVSLPRLADDIRREVEYLVASGGRAATARRARGGVDRRGEAGDDPAQPRHQRAQVHARGLRRGTPRVHDAKLRLLVGRHRTRHRARRRPGSSDVPARAPRVCAPADRPRLALPGAAPVGVLGGTVELTSDDAGTTIFESACRSGRARSVNFARERPSVSERGNWTPTGFARWGGVRVPPRGTKSSRRRPCARR